MACLLVAAMSAVATAGAPSVESPPLTGQTTPNDFAVVIANEDYMGFGAVSYATRDADAFAAWLTRTRGLKSVNVAHYYNESADGMEGAVADGAKRVGVGGTLWVYYAGHGLGLQSPDAAAPERVLLGINAMAKASELSKYVVPLSRLQKLAAGSKATQAIFVLDACFNNAGRNGDPLLDGRFAVPVGRARAATRVTVWSATDANETALPYEPAQHGAFTYFAVGALSGWADGVSDAPDGRVTLAEAQEWVGRAMNATGIRGQTPGVVGDAEVVAVSAAGKLAAEPAAFPRPGGVTRYPDVDQNELPKEVFNNLNIAQAFCVTKNRSSYGPQDALPDRVTIDFVLDGLGDVHNPKVANPELDGSWFEACLLSWIKAKPMPEKPYQPRTGHFSFSTTR